MAEAVAMVDYQPGLIGAAATLAPCSAAQANALLVHWGHYLGACARPFGAEGWVLDVAGRPVAVAVSASTVSATVAGYDRGQAVELARLCAAPDARWATRPMLRLWREVAAPAWRYWPVRAAVAYSHNRRHAGDLYRWDGWTLVTTEAGDSRGGGTYSTSRTVRHTATGRKTLWLWRYNDAD